MPITRSTVWTPPTVSRRWLSRPLPKLYREMGREFSSDSYYLEAIKSYRFLMEQYPQNRIRATALFTIGEVYRQDLEDPDEARKAIPGIHRHVSQIRKGGRSKGNPEAT